MLLATSVIISEQYPRQYWRPWDLCINSIWELQPWSKLSSPPIPPPPPVQCWRYGFKTFSRQSTLLRGGGTAETGSFNNISKHLLQVHYAPHFLTCPKTFWRGLSENGFLIKKQNYIIFCVFTQFLFSYTCLQVQVCTVDHWNSASFTKMYMVCGSINREITGESAFVLFCDLSSVQ